MNETKSHSIETNLHSANEGRISEGPHPLNLPFHITTQWFKDGCIGDKSIIAFFYSYHHLDGTRSYIATRGQHNDNIVGEPLSLGSRSRVRSSLPKVCCQIYIRSAT